MEIVAETIAWQTTNKLPGLGWYLVTDYTSLGRETASDVVSRPRSWSRDCLETKKFGLGLGLGLGLRGTGPFPSPVNATSPPLALSSAAFHSRLKIEIFKFSYPESIPAPPYLRHNRLPP